MIIPAETNRNGTSHQVGRMKRRLRARAVPKSVTKVAAMMIFPILATRIRTPMTIAIHALSISTSHVRLCQGSAGGSDAPFALGTVPTPRFPCSHSSGKRSHQSRPGTARVRRTSWTSAELHRRHLVTPRSPPCVDAWPFEPPAVSVAPGPACLPSVAAATSTAIPFMSEVSFRT